MALPAAKLAAVLSLLAACAEGVPDGAQQARAPCGDALYLTVLVVVAVMGGIVWGESRSRRRGLRCPHCAVGRADARPDWTAPACARHELGAARLFRNFREENR